MHLFTQTNAIFNCLNEAIFFYIQSGCPLLVKMILLTMSWLKASGNYPIICEECKRENNPLSTPSNDLQMFFCGGNSSTAVAAGGKAKQTKAVFTQLSQELYVGSICYDNLYQGINQQSI